MIRFVKQSQLVWQRMWAWLEQHTGSKSDRNPQSLERWQYVGTVKKNRPAIGSGLPLVVLVHQFHHRDRPTSAPEIVGSYRSHGRVLLEILTSHEFSGNWNRPLEEGSLR